MRGRKYPNRARNWGQPSVVEIWGKFLARLNGCETHPHTEKLSEGIEQFRHLLENPNDLKTETHNVVVDAGRNSDIDLAMPESLLAHGNVNGSVFRQTATDN